MLCGGGRELKLSMIDLTIKYEKQIIIYTLIYIKYRILIDNE